MKDNNELYHYGVLGMKWGIQKNASKAYGKASTKMNKLNSKVNKAKAKIEKAEIQTNSGGAYKYKKYQAKADKNRSKLFPNYKKADKYQAKANMHKPVSSKAEMKLAKAKLEHYRAIEKAKKWEKSMNKAFKNTDVNLLNANSISDGREYINKEK